MRNMAFSKTIPQIRDHTKTVTRRVGTWRDLQPGTLLCAVEKSQGLAKGEKVKRIGVIRVVSVNQERLCHITRAERRREGFPNISEQEFFAVLGAPPLAVVTRIEFEHVAKEHEDD